MPVIHADREGRALRFRIGHHHERELKGVGPLGQQRDADHARGVGQEEGNVLRRGRLGRHDQIAFVLAVLIIDDHGHAEAPDGVNGLLYL